MKKILLIILISPLIMLAQNNSTVKDTSQNKIVVTEDVKDCVDKIYDNTDALKLLLTDLMGDKAKMRQIHEEFMQDPQMRKVMNEMIKQFRDARMNNENNDRMPMMNDKNHMQMHDSTMYNNRLQSKDSLKMRDTSKFRNKMQMRDTSKYKENIPLKDSTLNENH